MYCIIISIIIFRSACPMEVATADHGPHTNLAQVF